MANLIQYIPTLLLHEGGFVNDPLDLGGATNKGVTIATYRHFYGNHKTIEDLKKISNAEVTHIAKVGFWDKIGGDQIKDQSLAELMFDFAWGSGNGRANKLVQNILNDQFGKRLVVDGVTGPKTIAAINSVDPKKLFNCYWEGRKKWLEYIVKKRPENSKFLKGWMNRLLSFPKKKLQSDQV